MNTPEKIRDNLLQILADNKLTNSIISRESGLPLSSVRHLTIDNQVPTLHSLCLLCNGLDISLVQLLEPQAVPEEALSLQERRLIKGLRALEPSQKQLAWALLNPIVEYEQ